MKPQLFALLTAAAWGIGGYFEKKGLHMGNLAPQMGIASFPHWQTVSQAGNRALVYMVVGGGLVAGSMGMLCFYIAIKGAPLSRVMPIAFHLAAVRGADEGGLRGGAADVQERAGDAVDGGGDHPVDRGLRGPMDDFHDVLLGETD